MPESPGAAPGRRTRLTQRVLVQIIETERTSISPCSTHAANTASHTRRTRDPSLNITADVPNCLFLNKTFHAEQKQRPAR
jgi:hypothetical protein